MPQLRYINLRHFRQTNRSMAIILHIADAILRKRRPDTRYATRNIRGAFFTRGSVIICCVLVLAALCYLPNRLSSPAALALDDGLARTPPMGWNSWNHFGCDIDERLIQRMADAMVASGMRDAGYQYVIVDDCWQ